MADAATLYDTYARAPMRFERGEGAGWLPKMASAISISPPASRSIRSAMPIRISSRR